MENKMIFIDIDGTLVAPHQSISELNTIAIDLAQKNGHKVFLCTGRNRCSITPDLEAIPFDGLITSAGSYIEIDHKMIYENYIEEDMINHLMVLFNEYDVDYSLEGCFSSFFSKGVGEKFVGHKIEDKELLDKEIKRVYEVMKAKEIDLYNNEGIHKISFITNDHCNLSSIVEYYKDIFTFVYHDLFDTPYINGEMILKGYNKATGIQYVLDYFNKDQSTTIGIGDSMNDFEMLEYCNYSIAMDKAPDHLKSICNIVARDASEDAIYHIFKDLNII